VFYVGVTRNIERIRERQRELCRNSCVMAVLCPLIYDQASVDSSSLFTGQEFNSYVSYVVKINERPD